VIFVKINRQINQRIRNNRIVISDENCILQGRVSKYVTNGSKTAVIDLIGFLCVSLGSSTIQLHASLGSRRACAHVQRLVSVVKMTTVTEECTTLDQRSVVRFLWARGLNANDIHKEMFPVHVWKYLSCKAVH
jgi:hypothetical protein